MKKNQYTCDTCGTVINTAQRDPGIIAGRIGCINGTCTGLADPAKTNVNQDIETHLVFIYPKNQKEWKIIYDDLAGDVEKRFPKANKSDKRKARHNVMERIRLFVKKGGIVAVPKKEFDKIPKMKVVKK